MGADYARFDWYGLVEGPDILQGDFLNNCPVLLPKDPNEIDRDDLDADLQRYDVVVMSQSCDLEQNHLDLVLVCPHWSLDDFANKGGDFFKSTEGKEQLRKGNVPGYHMLSESKVDTMARGIRVVDFRVVYSLPIGFIKAFAEKGGQRLRLLPPYREHLSQAFARYFMRVGLPVDIPPFKKAAAPKGT
jgi:hypothetical protein